MLLRRWPGAELLVRLRLVEGPSAQVRRGFPARPHFRRVMFSVRLQLAAAEVLWEDFAGAEVPAGAVGLLGVVLEGIAEDGQLTGHPKGWLSPKLDVFRF